MNKVNIRSLFYKNAAWNILDALGTQTLVVMHHILLHTYAGSKLHGLIGTIFSLLYMTVLIANGGFDFACAPFMRYYTANQTTFAHFARTKLMPQLCWLLAVTCLGGLLVYVLWLPGHLALILACAFLLESIKKSFKIVLQLLFYTKLTAVVEFMGMVLYCAGVWGWYYTGMGISATSAFCVLGIVSLGQALILGLGLCYWYIKTPATSIIQKPDQLNKRVAVSRLWISLQRIIEQVFSNNFLVPFFALSCGIPYVSYFKIVSSLARWVSLFGDKAFGTTSLMLLTSIPSLRPVIMQFINRLLRITILITCPLVIGISNYIGYYYCSVTSYSFILMCSALISLRFADMICVVYERWLLVEEKMIYVLMLSGTVAACTFIGITYYTLSPLQVVFFLMLARGVQALFCNWYIGYISR